MREGETPLTRIRASAVCVAHVAHEPSEGALLCVRLRDPSSGVVRVVPPGGAIERGETAAEAAAREALEETGYRVAVEPAHTRIARYPYTWDGVRRLVTTHFFRVRLLGDTQARPVRDASYNEGVVWLPLAALERELGFEPAILSAVRALIAPLKS